MLSSTRARNVVARFKKSQMYFAILKAPVTKTTNFKTEFSLKA